MNIKRYWFWFVVAVIVIVFLVVSLRPQEVLVETALVKKDELSLRVSEEGKTRVINRYEIFSPVSAYVRRVELDVGDVIERDQILVELEPLPSDVLDPRRRAEAQARVASAESALKAAEEAVIAKQADTEYAVEEFERKKVLVETRAISREEFHQAKTTVTRSEAELRSAKFAVEIARHDLAAAKTLLKYSGVTKSADDVQQTLHLHSPINGSVLKVLRKSEGVVAMAEPLLEVGNTQDLEVVVEVLSADAVSIKPGTPVLLKRWGGDTLQAQVSRVEPVAFTEVSALGVKEQRVRVLVDIHSESDRWSKLGDGYRVDAEFVLWQADKVLQVPESALLKSNQQWSVYIYDDGVARLRQVSVGRRTGLQAEILGGLDIGEQVILFPDATIEEGTKVLRRD